MSTLGVVINGVAHRVRARETARPEMVLHRETNRGDLAALLITPAAFYWRVEEASEPMWR